MSFDPRTLQGANRATLEDLVRQGTLIRSAPNAGVDSADPMQDTRQGNYAYKLPNGQYQGVMMGPDGAQVGDPRTPGGSKFGQFALMAGGLGALSGGLLGGLAGGAAPTAAGTAAGTTAGAAGTAAGAAGGTGLAGGLSSALSAIPGGAGTALMGASVLGDALSQSGPGAGPDFTSAATQQSQQQQAMNQDALNQNRYNEVTPYGSREWTRDANGNWTSTTSLSPEQQAIYDQENALSQQYGQTAQSLLSNAQDRLSNPFEFSGSDRQRVEDQIYGGMTSRLDDRFGRGEDQLRTRLTNQGITEGSEAWSNAMKDFNYSRNDAYQQALTASTGLGLNEANNEFNRQLTTYQQPLQSLSYLRSGNQAQVPQFGAGAQMQSAQAPNLMGAAQSQYGAQADQYNANAARRSNLFGGLFDIGSTLLRGK